MLIVEIFNRDEYLPEEQIGITRSSNYDYIVKVGRKEIARGSVEHERRTHFSLLLKTIADDAQAQELARIAWDIPASQEEK